MYSVISVEQVITEPINSSYVLSLLKRKYMLFPFHSLERRNRFPFQTVVAVGPVAGPLKYPESNGEFLPSFAFSHYQLPCRDYSICDDEVRQEYHLLSS